MKSLECNLTDCFLCKHCSPEWKELVSVKKETIAFKKGESIFTEGEKFKGIYFVYQGSAKVHKKWNEGKDFIIRFAKTGDVLGLRGIGIEDRYPVSATALEGSKACFIEINFFESTLKLNPSFTYSLLQLFATELQKAENRLRNLAHMDVKGRIADALIALRQVYGESKDKFIKLEITRQDISSYAGTTYETVFKFFTELQKRKVISTKGKRIKILQSEKLKDFTG
jgi:CRP/FNR family transcriptional regulator